MSSWSTRIFLYQFFSISTFILEGLRDLALLDLHVHSPFLLAGSFQHSHLQVIKKEIFMLAL